ncbi:MAG: hypothetical protein F9K16_01750, partial [Thermoanaerobaculia bacterium]
MAQSYLSRSIHTGGTTVELGDRSLDYPCAVDFENGLFPTNDLNGEVRAMTVFDDGSGPALYVGGTFTTARGLAVNRVARWDGSSWSALGPGLTASSSPSVDALIVFDDGSGPKLYAGGRFTSSGGATVRYVAKWNGTAWTQVGGNLNGQVLALAVHDSGAGPQLFATGTFTTSGSTTYNRIARLSGSSWVTLGTGLNSTGRALASFGGALYVGGSFSSAGGVAASRIARWNGASWSAVGSGVSGGSTVLVKALTTWDDGSGEVLAVGGRFSSAGGSTANHVATWDGAAWSSLASGLGVQVNALAAFDDGWGPTLYAAGSFSTISGATYNRIARWGVDAVEGGYWASIGNSSIGLNGQALALSAGTVDSVAGLFVGGAFTSADGASSSRVARLSRPVSCNDMSAPQVKIVDPSPGETTGDSTPAIRIAVPDRGEGADPATLIVRANGSTIAVSCTSAEEILDCESLSALAGAVTLSATIEDFSGGLSAVDSVDFLIADAEPPAIAIVDPGEGSTVESARPPIRIQYSDAGAGVDTATLAVTWNGGTLAAECQAGPSEAVCIPETDQPTGAATVTATVSDLQGNPSAPALRSFLVDAPEAPPATTFAGTVVFADGSPAPGATVRLSDRAAFSTTSAADGTFTLADVDVGEAATIAFTAKLWQPGIAYLGFASVVPMVGGVTPVTIELSPECDSYFSPLALDGDRSGIALVPTSLSSTPLSFASFDSGEGPEVIVAGSFNHGGAGDLGRIARWTSRGWQRLGGGLANSKLDGIQPEVRALAVYDDGSGAALYAGGRFTRADGKPSDYLARWDGSVWSEAARGVDKRVTGLAVFDDGAGPELFVAGELTRVGTRKDWTGQDYSISAAHVAKWNGSIWTDVGTGVVPTNVVNTPLKLSVFDTPSGPQLYLWEESGYQVWRRVAGTWQAIEVPIELYGITSIAQHDDGSGSALHLAAGGIGIQKLVGSTWVSVFADDYQAKFIASFGDSQGNYLYASGHFVDRPDYTGERELRRWNGSTWSAPLTAAERIARLDVPGLGARLILSPYAGSTSEPAWHPAEWKDGARIDWSHPVAIQGGVRSVAFAESPQGEIVLFSGPTRVGSVQLDGRIGRWDGQNVAESTDGLLGGTRVLPSFDGRHPRVYGLAESSGQVAEWTGTSWTPVGGPLGPGINAVDWAEVNGEYRLYAAGPGLFRWNGTFWHPIPGAPAVVTDIEGFGGSLYTPDRWRWDGTNWTQLAPPPASFAASEKEGAPIFAASEAPEMRPVVPGTVAEVQVGLEAPFGEDPSPLWEGTVPVTRRLVATSDRLHFLGMAWAWTGSSWVDAGVQPRLGYLRNRFLSPTVGSSQWGGFAYVLERYDDGSEEKVLVGGNYAATKNSPSSGWVLQFPNLNLGERANDLSLGLGTTGVDGPPVVALAAGRWRGAPAVAVGGGFGETGGESSGGLAIWHPTPVWGECSTSGRPPVITVTSPAGAFTSAAVETIAGELDEPAELTVDGVAVVVEPDRTFEFSSGPLVEGENHFFLRATGRAEDVSTLAYVLLRDTTGPTLAITSPSEGAHVFTGRPRIELALDDGGSGIAPETLTVTLSGEALSTGECVVRATSASCQPELPLPVGPFAMTAQIADRAGNLSPLVQGSFEIVSNGEAPTTTIVGEVRLPGGAPASGARVRVLGRSGIETSTASDGSFSLPVPSIVDDRPLRAYADLEQGTEVLGALSAELIPVPSGITDAGLLVLGPACDLEVASELFGTLGVSGEVYSAAVFDDGSGAALYIGGSAVGQQGTGSVNLAKWDGERFVGVAGAPNDGVVRALTVWNEGTGELLYVGGNFTTAGGQTVNGFAAWSGSSWTSLDGGVTTELRTPTSSCTALPGSVYGLRVGPSDSGEALYVAGSFTRVGSSLGSDMVAKWTGSGWESLGARPSCILIGPLGPELPTANAMAVYDAGAGPELYVGGSFTSIAGVVARGVARRQGGAWAEVGGGIGLPVDGELLPARVNAMTVYDAGSGPELVVGGYFSRAGLEEVVRLNVARWNGLRWAAFGEDENSHDMSFEDLPGVVGALAAFDDGSGEELYVGGSFWGETSEPFGSLARWNGLTWVAVGEGIPRSDEKIRVLFPWGNDLVAGGGFSEAGDRTVRGIARWDGQRWRPFGKGLDGEVRALTVFDDGTGPAIHLGGDFEWAGDRKLNHVARFDGTAFHPLGAGVDGPVHALESFTDVSGPGLFVGGRFDSAGGSAAANIARWSGWNWSALGSGLSHATSEAYVYAIETYDAGTGLELYAGGSFDTAGGAAASNIARWSNGSWSALGAGTDQRVEALATAEVAGVESLFVGGRFLTAGGGSASKVARWDGTWNSLGSGVSGTSVLALHPWAGGTLLVGGDFALNNPPNLGVWNGSSWLGLGSGPLTVQALEVWDNGSGPAIYAGAGEDLVRWNGSNWTTAVNHVNGSTVRALAAIDEMTGSGLYLGGFFATAGVEESAHLARLQRTFVCTDRTGPVVTIQSPEPGQWLRQSRPAFSFSMVDAVSGVDPDTIALRIDGASIAASCSTSASDAVCYPDAPVSQGTHAALVSVDDLAGNTGSASVGFSLDGVAPTVTFTSPAPGSILTTSTPTFAFTFGESGSGVDPLSVAVELSGTTSFGLDCSYSVVDGTCAASGPIPDARIAIEVRVEDLAGNVSSGPVAEFFIDTLAPNIAVLDPADGQTLYAAPSSIVVAVEEAGSGLDVASAIATLDGAPLAVTCAATEGRATCDFTPPLANGPHTITLSIADRAAQRSAIASASFDVLVDTDPPALAFTQPTSGATVDLRTTPFMLAWSDAISGIAQETLRVRANGQPLTATCQLSPTSASCLVPQALFGSVSLEAQVEDLAGNLSPIAAVSFDTPGGGPDPQPPTIEILSPGVDVWVNASPVEIRGRVSEPASLAVDGQPVTVHTDRTFSFSRALVSGPNAFLLVATDLSNNTGQLSLSIGLDETAPLGLDDGLVTVAPSLAGHTPFAGSAGAVLSPETEIEVEARSRRTGAAARVSVNPDRSFAGTAPALPGDVLELRVVDRAGNASAAVVRDVSGVDPTPPSPDPSQRGTDVASPFCARYSYLWSGPSPAVFGVAEGALDCARVAIVRGRVLDDQGTAIEGALVRAPNDPGAGLALSRADGWFDLGVNGGGPVLLEISKAGWLTVWRTPVVAWNRLQGIDDVLLTPRSTLTTSVELASQTEMEPLRGPVESDAAGSRQATILLPAATQAVASLPGGGSQPLTQLTFRATEYTVGDRLGMRLPGPLPDRMDPTLVVELSIDEAEALGSRRVDFSQPLPFLVENFMDFPTGTSVASAWWDPDQARWVAADDGRVIRILAVASGSALLDVEGNGEPAGPAELAALGISAEERIRIAELYPIGSELIRGRVDHFTGWYWGLPRSYAAIAALAPGSPLPPPHVLDERLLENPSVGRFGGLVDTENRILGQLLPVVGAPVALSYASDRVPGRITARSLVVPLTGPAIPEGLESVELTIESAGHREFHVYPAAPDQTASPSWDGEDAHGKTATSPEAWTVRIAYVYPATYVAPAGSRTFDLPGGIRIELGGREPMRISRTYTGAFPLFDAKSAFGMGGWGLNLVHRYDPLSRTVFYGDGSRRSWSGGPAARDVLVRVAGNGEAGLEGDGGPAREASLSAPYGVSVTPKGDLLVADKANCRIRRVRKDGSIATVAGSVCPTTPANGDGGPATAATLASPRKAVENSAGEIFIAEATRGAVRRVSANGIISTLTLLDSPQCFATVTDVDLDPAGNVYVTSHGVENTHGTSYNAECGGVFRIAPDGTRTRASVPWHGYAQLAGADVLDDGRVIVSKSSCVFESEFFSGGSSTLLPNPVGACHLYGPGEEFDRGDGEPAGEATRFFGPSHVAVAGDGTIYLADTINRRVRAIGADGMVRTVVGGGTSLSTEDGVAATRTALLWPTGVALSPDGRALYVVDSGAHMVWRMTTPSPADDGEYEIPSPDGSVLHVFDALGYLLRTEDALSRRTLWTFTYEEYASSDPDSPPERYVTQIRDAFDNTVMVQRDGAGLATKIVGPFGHETSLITDPVTGYLSEVSWPVETGSEAVEPTHRADGLLQNLRDPNGGLYDYVWDLDGRLERIDDPALGSFALATTGESRQGRSVSGTSALGRSGQVAIEFLPQREVRTTHTSPANLQSWVLVHPSGIATGEGPDGSTATVTTVPDRVHGPLLDALSALSATSPGGKALSVEATTTGISDLSDPLRTRQRTDTVTVNGRTSTVAYDGDSRTVITTSPAGRSATTHLDAHGRPQSVVRPGTEEVRYVYDARGRLERIEQGSGENLRSTQYGYHPAAGWLATVTDTLGRTVTYERDPVGRVKKQILPDLREIGFTYDANGNVTTVTPPTRPAHAFDYTVVDQVELYTPPEAGFTPRATSYDYNADRQVTLITRPDGQTIVPTYEPNGRLDFLTLPTGTIDVGYDAVGRVESITAPGGVGHGFVYDGSFLTSLSTTGPVAGAVSFDYDSDLRVSGQTVLGGPVIGYGYDADGLLTSAGSLSLTRNPASGRLETTTLDATTDARTRTSFGELDTWTGSYAGTPLYAYDLDRDAAGRISRKTETIGAMTAVWEYAYHPQRGWLTEVKKDTVVVASYGYDDNGNRTSWSDFWGSGIATYDDQDRQLTAGPVDFTYTANGELLTKTAGPDVTGYLYDVRGALLAVDLPNGIEIDYLVDASGRRIGKKINGVLTKGWIYAGGLSPLAETDGSGAVTQTYVYATKGSVPDYLTAGGETYRIFTDHLGSVRLVVNVATGAIAQRIDYDAWGRITLDTNPGFQPFGFAGGIYDHQTGLVRFGARDYDPEVGRWTAKDPIGFGGGSALLYEYCANDPINAVDPSGLWITPW